MKKILSILTVAAFSLMVTHAALAADIPSDWAEREVEEAIYLRFVPDELQTEYTANITRAQFAKTAVLYLAATQNLSVGDFMNLYFESEFWAGSPSIMAGMPFANFAMEKPFTDIDDFYVNRAYNLGIVNGRGEGIFDPDSSITRQEAAVMLLNVYTILGGFVATQQTGFPFSDATELADWASYSAAIMYQYGIMNGVSADMWNPLGYYTREQCFATFLRLYKYWPEGRWVLLPYEEARESVLNRQNTLPYHIDFEADCKDYSVYYFVQPGVPGGCNYRLLIAYRSGGLREVLHEGGLELPSNSMHRSDFEIYDLAISDDETALTFKRDFNDLTYHYSVDLATGKLTENL